MGKTKRGSKHDSFEYWGKRALSMVSPSKFIKTLTNRIERRRRKKEASQVMQNSELQ